MEKMWDRKCGNRRDAQFSRYRDCCRHSTNAARDASRSAFRRRAQTRRNLAQNLLVVRRDRPLHMNPGTLHSRFLRQPLELSLQKNFQLLRRQEGNLNRRRVAAPGLDLHAVWGFELLRLRFRCQVLPPCFCDDGWSAKLEAF